MDFEQLRKVLELESSRGLADTAVSGGLDKLLARLSPEHLSRIVLPLPSYRELSPEARQRWVDSTLAIIAPSIGRPARKGPALLPADLDSPITDIKGISTKLAAKFERLGVTTIRDVLYFFPRRHIDYRSPTPIAELQPDIEQTILVQVWEAAPRKSRRGMKMLEVIVGDSSGNMKVTFFNQPYLAQKFKPNTRLLLSGRAKVYRGSRTFQPSSYELLESADMSAEGQLIPIYPLTEGLFPRQVRRLVRQTMDQYLPNLADFLPETMRRNAGLISLAEAIRQAHYPVSESARYAARRRLAFDELLLIQIGVLMRKRRRQEGTRGVRLTMASGRMKRFLSGLPFELTGAQQRALREVLGDLSRGRPMSRLLHGDVGSGKTVVATAAMLVAVAGGCQAALMAPTEILAEQHFRNICDLLGGGGGGEGIFRAFDSVLDRSVSVGLLTGSIRQKAKKELQHSVSTGEADILIGTQALIQKKVEFRKLGLVIVDEQHRFGVMQRLALRQKGVSPHMLAMSATPIPRTLALTLYGDLDISLIDELPPGRQPIKTRWLGPRQRRNGYNFLRREAGKGRQAYIICPLVEESESIEAKAATAEYERLSREVFPDLRLGLLHGRMSAKEKDEVMQVFRHGEIDILVSTSVVEVGVDVPNATVMLVEGADRFGLSQLHQFRGRVWRSSHQGYCILISDSPTEDSAKRLRAMEETHDGFILAEKDLELRGPGEFFGTRQSGLPDLKMARLTDAPLLELAREQATRLVAADSALKASRHRALAGEVARLWEGKGE